MKIVNISKNLKRLLVTQNKNSSELAIYLDVSGSLISSYITKNTLPPIDKIIKIAYFFNTSIDDLIFEKNNDELNLLSEPNIEYGSTSIKKMCVLTGGDCSFREMDGLRLENDKLRKELEKMKKGK